METEVSRRCYIVLVPAPFQGHLTPMLLLGKILESRGFSIIVVHTEYNAPKPSNHPEFLFKSIPDNMSADDDFKDPLTFNSIINNNCKPHLIDCLTLMMENDEFKGQIACIIHDKVMYYVQDVVDHLKVPCITFFSNASYLRARQVISRLQAENRLPLSESELLRSVPEFPSHRFKDIGFMLNSEIPKPGVELFYNFTNIGSSVAVLLDTTEEIEDLPLSHLQQHYKIPFFGIGPFHKMAPPAQTSLLEEDQGCMTWLDQQRANSVLYVSMGSGTRLDKGKLEEMAWGLANSEQPFLWVIRPGSVKNSNWIEQLPEGFVELIGDRGLIVKWAPQKKVLEHPAVGGFWSHCGWNSTLESIAEGVPMICMPHFGDQTSNTRYVTHVWKVGLELGQPLDGETVSRKASLELQQPLDRGTIEKTIRRLLVDVGSEEIRKQAIIMKKKVDLTILPGGSSYNSLNNFAEFISHIGEASENRI